LADGPWYLVNLASINSIKQQQQKPDRTDVSTRHCQVAIRHLPTRCFGYILGPHSLALAVCWAVEEMDGNVTRTEQRAWVELSLKKT